MATIGGKRPKGSSALRAELAQCSRELPLRDDGAGGFGRNRVGLRPRTAGRLHRERLDGRFEGCEDGWADRAAGTVVLEAPKRLSSASTSALPERDHGPGRVGGGGEELGPRLH